MKDTITDKHIKIFAQRLRALRNEKGYTQKDLAKIIDCPPSLISYYENAKKRTRIHKYFEIMQGVRGVSGLPIWTDKLSFYKKNR
jgi:transcriptional regulator with XRE-family HTH domain